MSVEFTETTDEPEDSSSLIDEPPITVEPELIIFEPRPQGISAKSIEIAYKICPCFDYIQPEDSRMLRISISTPTKPNKTHGFIYETLPLSNMQGYGIAASQYWNENDLDQKEKYLGTFVCREAESKTGYSLQYNRRLTFEDTAPVSFNDSTDSDDHAPQTCDIK
ncbi:unnamed protein product [Gongylonema pulchrum]|uniref:SH2 domain-containing protein n=1 Tax=Gongylonema pulchrum TaxID=637853 RepID=A0A183DW31_9BILA|nr:unnamed protein product [Gongylonema pulchrum]